MATFNTPLSIDQGSTFSYVATWTAGDPAVPVNLTGCTARAQFRSDITSSVVLCELTTANSRITLGGTAGTITLSLSDTVTAAFDWTEGVYDLEIVYANSTVKRLLQGTVTVSPEVTR
jgi:hypothetical protein